MEVIMSEKNKETVGKVSGTFLKGNFKGFLKFCVLVGVCAAGILTTGCGQSSSIENKRQIEVKEAKAMNTVSVRYIVNDVDAAIEFYTKLLGFHLDLHPAPGFAGLSRGSLRLLLNAPGAGGAGQEMPDGSKPAPGGWNRIQLEVGDLSKEVEKLRQSNAHFRNEIVTGNGGKQILLDDPSGNAIELFEPPPKGN
jgi:catechol 2,3-dioxygenase-like lactoylglutathione lyase family enzyme